MHSIAKQQGQLNKASVLVAGPLRAAPSPSNLCQLTPTPNVRTHPHTPTWKGRGNKKGTENKKDSLSKIACSSRVPHTQDERLIQQQTTITHSATNNHLSIRIYACAAARHTAPKLPRVLRPRQTTAGNKLGTWARVGANRY